jgi:glutamyl-tRNA reductase
VVRVVDRLEAVTEKTRQMRRQAAERVERIVDEEFERLLDQYKRKRADRVISAMYESADRVKASELDTALTKLDLDEEQAAVVESMADAIVSQLLAAPTKSLRDAAEDDDWTTIHTALQLFDPTGGAPSQLADAEPDEIPDAVRQQMPSAVLDQLGVSND